MLRAALDRFLAYKLVPVTMWNSARTSVTAALMSMAMASILKVCLMRKKEGNGYCAKQKGHKRREKRKRSRSNAR